MTHTRAAGLGRQWQHRRIAPFQSAHVVDNFGAGLEGVPGDQPPSWCRSRSAGRFSRPRPPRTGRTRRSSPPPPPPCSRRAGCSRRRCPTGRPPLRPAAARVPRRPPDRRTVRRPKSCPASRSRCPSAAATRRRRASASATSNDRRTEGWDAHTAIVQDGRWDDNPLRDNKLPELYPAHGVWAAKTMPNFSKNRYLKLGQILFHCRLSETSISWRMTNGTGFKCQYVQESDT